MLDFANKRWIGGLNLLTNRGRHYHVEAFEDMVRDFEVAAVDHVLCTGDVTNLAFEHEFLFARERFDRIGLGPKNVTVLPGNHDCYVAEGSRHFAAIFADYFASDEGWQWQPGDDDTELTLAWPLVRVRGDVAIVGLSTSLATPWFTAWGRVGERQLERFRAALADPRLAGKLRVVAIHHPPAGSRSQSRVRGLRDRDAVAAVLAEVGADLVVHGHEHQDLVAELPGPGGRAIPVLGVASGTYLAGKTDRIARYRIFEIEGGIIRAQETRVWQPEQKTFARLESAQDAA